MLKRLSRLFLLTILLTAVAWSNDTWFQVDSPHFTVFSNGSEKQARRMAREFEQMRLLFEKGASKLRLDSGSPIYVIAARDEGTMKRLFPQYWEHGGHVKPAGLFARFWEKSFAVVRLDAVGEDAYQTVYHEYIHYLLSLNFRRLPVWLNEGMAEFYGNARLRETEATIALPSRVLGFLRPTTWIPLEKVISVTPDSPYYTEASRAGLFYAEAWLLTHYLILGKNMNGGALLNEFGKLLQEGEEEGEAFRKVFGDPDKMNDAVSNYARQRAFISLSGKTDLAIKQEQFSASRLSDGQWAAFLGGFEISQRRLKPARVLLQQALVDDPTSPVANENMGFLLFHEGKDTEAALYFQKALAKNPKAYLSAYYHAMLTLGQSESVADARALDGKLGEVLEMNPQFAPAFVALSLVKVRLGDLPLARGLAVRATQLEPGRSGYLLNVARIRHRMGESAMAEDITRMVAKRWRGADRDEALELMADLAHSGAAAIEPESNPTSFVANDKSLSADGVPPTAGEKLARGTIESASCSETSQEISLKQNNQTAKFKFADKASFGIADTVWYGADHFDPCQHVTGRPAVIRYKQGSGDFAGEITAFALRDVFPEPPAKAAQPSTQ